MRSFELNRVLLTDGAFAERQRLVLDYVKQFDINRLMHTFRVNANIESNAEPLGGWEDPGCQLRGHFVGHFLSACAKFAYGANDAECAKKASDIVDIMEECARDDGYLSAYEERQLDIIEHNEDSGVWAPYYTLHKILAGLVACGSYLGNEKAIRLAENLALYIYRRFEKLSFWKIDNMLKPTRLNPVNEFGGIGDSLYGLWELTKNEKVLELAKLFDRDYFLGRLAKGNDILADLHANTHLPLVIGALHRYTLTGEAEYKTAALNFYNYLVKRTFANGNNSAKAAHPPKGALSERAEHWSEGHICEADITGGESESCCGHNTEIILSYLLEIDPDSALRYLEHLEGLKYNAVLNCASSETGLSQYHQPMGRDQTKKFSSLYNDFWCCTASGVEAMSELQKNIWFYGDGMILLNMFVPSVLTLDAGTKLTLKTDYPVSTAANITVSAESEKELSLAFKKGQISNVRINGAAYNLISANGYDMIRADLSDGDVISFDICAGIRIEPLTSGSDVFSVKYGNILLAKTEGEYSIDEEITNIDGVFKSANAVFKPLYSIENETYTVYINSGKSSRANDGSEAYQ